MCDRFFLVHTADESQKLITSLSSFLSEVGNGKLFCAAADLGDNFHAHVKMIKQV